MTDRPDLDRRKQLVRDKMPIASAIERHVKLSGSASASNRRGKCPFHNGNSASFSVKPADGYAHCFGCQWHGDVIEFTKDVFGLSWIDALRRLEAEIGEGAAFAPAGAGPVQRERNPSRPRARERQLVEPIDMGRAIWRQAQWEPWAIRRYFTGRGVPEALLADGRLVQFRYHATCPVHRWDVGADGRGDMRKVPVAPAVIAMVRVPRVLTDPDGASGRLEFIPVGVHVTYLDPTGTRTMVRRKPWAKADDEDPYFPKRRMLGPTGKGAVLLGEYSADVHLWVGEGNETVLSGMALSNAGAGDVGVATLSLDNLQGDPKLWQGKYGRIWPLHAMRPDPERRPCFTIPGHRGPVTGLIDADMSPLRGMKDAGTGAMPGESVVEHKGGPIVRRAITGAERARICAELFVQGWRAAGVSRVDAVRAPLGMDFNDAIQGEAA